MARKRRGRGEGAIHQLASGLWQGKISLGFSSDGKRLRKTVYAPSKTELLEKIRQLQSDFALGQFANPESLTVEAWLVKWLDTNVKLKASPTTHDRYEGLARLHIIPYIGHLALKKLSPFNVNNLLDQLEKKGATLWTRKMAAAVLHNAMHRAVRMQYIVANPCADTVRARPGEREMLILTEAEARALLKAAEDVRLYALFALALGSGMRQGELLGLQWPDLDFEKGTLSVKRSLAQVKGRLVLKEPKSKRSRRTIRLPPFVLDALAGHRKRMLAEGQNVKTGTVFVTKTGNYLGKSNLIRQVFKPLLKKAGVPVIRFHDLRHTHASVLLAHGESIKAVSSRLGHSDVALTLRVYAHLLPDADNSLAETAQKAFA
jgi:integrase